MFAKILKANPYHDEQGLFTTKDKAKDNGVTLYHGTSADNVESIMKDGLMVKPEKRTHGGLKFYYKGERGESVYLTSKKETADYYAEEASKISGSKLAVLKIVVPKKAYEKFKPDEYEADSYRTLGSIPPQWIKSVLKSEGVALFMCVLMKDKPAKKSDDFLQILKFNPYHDEQGLFTTQEKASTHSQGGVVTRLSKAHNLTAAQFEDDVDALKKSGKLFDDGGDGDNNTEDALYASQGRMKMSELVQALTGGDAKAEASFRAHGKVVWVDVKGSVYGAKIYGKMKRIFDFERGVVEHDFLELHEASQGSGTIKKMFKAVVPEYEKMGMKSITLGANLDVGGYAWAKYGFEAADPGKFNPKLDVRVRARLERWEKKTETETYADLGPGVKKEAAAVRELLDKYKDDPKLVQLIADLKTPNLDRVILSPGITFAKDILMGESWTGVLHLGDKTARKRLKEYIGA